MNGKLICLSLATCLAFLISNTQAVIVLPNAFTFSSGINTTISSTFRITPETPNSSFRLVWSCPFPITFNQTYFPELNTFYDNSFNISVPYEADEGTYNGVIWIYGENDTKRINLTINVLPWNNFTVPAAMNMTFKTGQQGIFFINLNNLGNTKNDVVYQIDNNIFGLIPSTGKFTVFPRMSFNFPVPFSIADNFNPGNYTVNVTFNSGTQNHRTTLNVTILDNDTPEIYDLVYSPRVEAATQFSISFSTKDNKELSAVWMTYGAGNRIDFDRLDVKHSTDLKFYDKGEKILTIFANDTSGNLASKTINITLYPKEITTVYDIGYYQVKKGYQIKKLILHSDEPIKMKARIDDVKYKLPNETLNETVNYRMAFSIPGKEFNINNGEETDFDSENVTDLYFIFESEWTGDFQAKITLTPPDWVKEEPYELDFHSFVGDYNIPEYIYKVIGNVQLDCRPNISLENFPDSKWICTESHPIDTDPANIGRFMTGDEYDAIKSNFETQKTAIIKEKDTTIFQGQVLTALVFIVALTGFVIWVWFGRHITYKPWW